MKILIVTNLYRNPCEPGKAEYHTQQFKALSKIADIKIVSPIPFFKFSNTQVPHYLEMDGIDVYYPRYLVIPKILRQSHALTMYSGISNLIRNIQQEFDFDIILASWAYPDGVATHWIGKKINKPVVILALGTDINVTSQKPYQRRIMSNALSHCAKVIAVSKPLKQGIIDISVPGDKVTVLENGVNKDQFFPIDMMVARNKLGLKCEQKLIIYIGNFAHIKGVDRLLEAAKCLPRDVTLALVGDGPMKAQLQSILLETKPQCDIQFVGRKPHNEIPLWMNAANVFCLPSRNEGCPNVILESISCGTPVVAFKVGGIPYMVKHMASGLLADEQTPKALGESLNTALTTAWNKSDISQNSSPSWDENAKELMQILTSNCH